MTYRVERAKRAAKYFATADKSLTNGFVKKMHLFEENPFETNTKLDISFMKGTEGIRKRRIGNYRLAYEVYPDDLVVLILDADSRGGIYKRR